MKLVTFEEFGKAFVPERFRPNLRKYLMKAGMYEVPYSIFGLLFIISVLISAAVYIIVISPHLEGMSILAIFGITFGSWAIMLIVMAAFLMLVIYAYVDMRIQDRTKKIEDVLDDFLMLVSENLKGSMSLDKALWNSVKPEFGVLAREIEVASKKVATGEEVEDALGEFIEKYDSPMTRRAFELIIEDSRTGGQIAFTIDKIIDDIKETKLLRADMIATNTQYVLFIGAIVLVISPLLFALSYQLLNILVKFSAKLAPAMKGATTSMPFTLNTLNIRMQDFVTFSRFAIGMVAVFSSMIISEINRGDVKSGLKYIPAAVVASLIVYEIFLRVFSTFFSGLII